jgi:2'-5' RNA ligase
MRLFVGLDIDDAVRERIVRFMEGVQPFSPDARWVKFESLHITLKFIGEKPIETVADLKRVLANVDVEPVDLTFRGFGFFPTPHSARVFWLGIEAPPQLAKLAKAVDEATAALGVPKENHPFSPHLTLARGRGGSGSPRRQRDDRLNSTFQHLQKKLATRPTPEFGTMVAPEFCLYQSQLSPRGSRYTKLERFPLRRRLS